MSKYLDQARAHLEATEEIELSFGPVVVKVNVSLLDLAAAGHIPAALLTDVDEMAAKARKDPKKAGMEGFEKLMPALNALAVAAFVDPPVTKDGGADSLPVDAIPFLDKVVLFERLNRRVEPLRDFRGQQGQSNGAAHSGDDVSLPAVGNSED